MPSFSRRLDGFLPWQVLCLIRDVLEDYLYRFTIPMLLTLLLSGILLVSLPPLAGAGAFFSVMSLTGFMLWQLQPCAAAWSGSKASWKRCNTVRGRKNKRLLE